MASRSQDPTTTTGSAPKGKTSKPSTQETPSATASAPKSRASKTTKEDVPSTAKAAPKSTTSKAVKEDVPAAAKAAPKSMVGRSAATQEQAPAAVSAPKSRSTASDDSEVKITAAEVKTALPDDLRAQWIAEAAYFIAERRGFSGGSADEDWREAEALINRMLAATRH